MSREITAAELFALSQGRRCEGVHECHWCGGPATDDWIHDDPAPVPFTRSNSGARRPGARHVCVGCWLFRRGSVTAFRLGGAVRDRQSPRRCSWLVTKAGAWALGRDDAEALYERLLHPPRRFALLLAHEGVENHIHLAVCNQPEGEIRAETPLALTLDNYRHPFTTYELEHAILHGAGGRATGVRALLEMFGPAPGLAARLASPERKPARGRPTTPEEDKLRPHRKLVLASGAP